VAAAAAAASTASCELCVTCCVHYQYAALASSLRCCSYQC
jgi:hypothetical protein